MPGWTDPTEIPSEAFPPPPVEPAPLPFLGNHLPFPSGSKRTTFPGFAGPTVAPLTHKTSTRNAAISQTFWAFLSSSGERTWWTVSDLARGELPWWRLERKWKRERRARATSLGEQTPQVEESRESTTTASGRYERWKGKRPLASVGLHRRCRSDETTHSGEHVAPPSAEPNQASTKRRINVSVPSRYPGYDTISPASPVLMLGGFRGSVLETVVDPPASAPSEAPRQPLESGSSSPRSSASSVRSALSTASAPATPSPRHAGLEAFPVAPDDDDGVGGPPQKRKSRVNLFKDGQTIFGHPIPSFAVLDRKKEHDLVVGSGTTTPQKVWPNMAAAMFNPGHPDLAMLLIEEKEDPTHVGPGPQEVVAAANGLRASHAVNTIGGIVNMGWGLRRRLERMERDGRIGELSRWGFDFRASLARSSKLLIAQATKLRDNSPTRQGVTVFAHSMGGLCVAHAVATCPDPTVFERVIYFGTPWMGCAGIMGPLRIGDGFLRQEAICDAVTSTSWPASFHLLPTDPTYYTPDGSPVPIDLYDVNSWDTWGLSPLAAGINEAVSDGARPGAAHEMPPPAKRAASVASVAQLPRSMSGGSELREMAQLSLAAEAVGAGQAEAGKGSSPIETLGFPVSASVSRRGTGPPPPSSTLASAEPARTSSENEKRSRRASDKVEAYLKAKGPFHPVNASPQVIHAHFRRVLAGAQQFRQDILDGYSEEKAQKGLYPPTVVIASRSTETIKGAMISEPTPEALARETHDKLIFEWGDGVVTWDSATHVPGKWGRHVIKGPPALCFPLSSARLTRRSRTSHGKQVRPPRPHGRRPRDQQGPRRARRGLQRADGPSPDVRKRSSRRSLKSHTHTSSSSRRSKRWVSPEHCIVDCNVTAKRRIEASQ